MLLLKLPVCPYCNAVYSYKEVDSIKRGKNVCYHCKKEFIVSKTPGKMLFIMIVCAVLILINLIIIISTDNLTIVTVLMDLFTVTAAVLMLPLTVKFKKEKPGISEQKNKKKNK